MTIHGVLCLIFTALFGISLLLFRYCQKNHQDDTASSKDDVDDLDPDDMKVW